MAALVVGASVLWSVVGWSANALSDAETIVQEGQQVASKASPSQKVAACER